MTWRAILTAGETRSAEAAVIETGTTVETLMERAGATAAEAIRLYAGAVPALILCGSGNNGGDGYVIARLLRERGLDVRVAALNVSNSPAAQAARNAWNGPIEELANAPPAPLLVDALFGTGLTRSLQDDVAGQLLRLADQARIRVAIDLPSGVATDDGSILSPVPDFDLTISFASLKPSHFLQPAAGRMGRVVVADIGVAAASRLHEIGRPRLRAPSPGDHKYSRGYVAVLASQMPGAAALTASAALRGGAGYVRLIADRVVAGVPRAVVQGSGEPAALLEDSRIGAIAVGPGLGRDAGARALLDAALAADRPLVLDADALFLLGERDMALRSAMSILTPHAGEFSRLFPGAAGSKVEQARQAARESGAIVVYKGADTVVAEPDGRAALARPAPSWLASAGTGDVLTGVIAAMRAGGLPAFEAACAGIWLHGRAAELAGPGLIADDLLRHLPAALAECL